MNRLLRVCAYLVLAVVVLVAGAYVVHGLHGVAQVSQAKQQAAADLADALPTAERQAIRDRDAVRKVTATNWGRPAYAWQELTCGLNTVEGGWIVEYYTQECQIHSVDVFPAARTAARGEGGVPGWDCDFSSLDLEFSDDPRASRVPWAEVESGPSSALAGESPADAGCPDDLLGPSRSGVSRLLSGARPASLAESPAWTVVTVSTEVSTTDLGCSPWGVLFCSAPVEHPVLGDLDEETG